MLWMLFYGDVPDLVEGRGEVVWLVGPLLGCCGRERNK